MYHLLRAVALCGLALTGGAADFSYYVVALTYTPNYCAQAGTKDARLCGSRVPALVIRGLMPFTESGQPVQRCGGARSVPADVVRKATDFLPSEAAIQREWSTYGSCTGLSADDYFGTMRR